MPFLWNQWGWEQKVKNTMKPNGIKKKRNKKGWFSICIVFVFRSCHWELWATALRRRTWSVLSKCFKRFWSEHPNSAGRRWSWRGSIWRRTGGGWIWGQRKRRRSDHTTCHCQTLEAGLKTHWQGGKRVRFIISMCELSSKHPLIDLNLCK